MNEAVPPAKPKRPKKPAGWWSAAAKQRRARERSNKRRLKLAAERARLRRRAKTAERNADMGKTAARRVAPIVLAKSIADAKAPPPRKKTKKAKPATVATRPQDAIAVLAKQRDINTPQRLAAEHYRDAYEAVQSYGLSGTLNPDRGSGGGGTGRGIAERITLLGGRLNQARQLLGERNALIVSEIVGKGITVAEFARSRGLKLERVRGRLGGALDVLAEAWFPAGAKKNRVSSWRASDAKPIDDGQKTTFERMRVAHAGGEKKLSYSEARPTKPNAKRA